MKFLNYIFLFFTIFIGPLFISCSDELSFPETEMPSDEDELADVPDEIKDGYSVSFQVHLDPMSGEQLDLTTRATSQSLRDIERFIDIEKLRILFFTCLDDSDIIDAYGNKIEKPEIYSGTQYESGQHDIFLFEAKTRWVSILPTATSSEASHQVTVPVFTYGNSDDYNWERIRDILKTRPFKIVILANRPDSIRYSDFDANYGKDPFFYGNRGPYWGVEESNAGIAAFEIAASKVPIPFNNIGKPSNWPAKAMMINNLHHCQWDPVYANKNKGNHCYDFMLDNPQQHLEDKGNANYSGAVTSWTKWMTYDEWLALTNDEKTFAAKHYHYEDVAADSYNIPSDYIMNKDDWYKDANGDKLRKRPLNFYQLPDEKQGIPMYGVQKFDPLKDWRSGTPMNLSPSKNTTTNTTYNRKLINLIRSLARIELYIPTHFDGEEFEVTEPALMYSNVFGRCEPMDVATPTERLMDINHTDACEWNDIYSYGPIIDGKLKGDDKSDFLGKMAWFYGIWRFWDWDYNDLIQDPKTNTIFNTHPDGKPSPHIYNSCIQRNGTARLEFVRTSEDQDQYYHYVIYTGERNINDPNSLTNFTSMDKTETMYFKFNIGEKTYCLPINPLKSQDIKNYLKANNESDIKSGTKFKTTMISNKDNWNYPIMRNHTYTFRVTKANGKVDGDGLGALVIVAEDRSADFEFY